MNSRRRDEFRGMRAAIPIGVVECHSGGGDGELRVAIEALQAMRWKMFFRNPVDNLPGAMGVELRSVEARDGADTALFRAQSAPEIFAPNPDGGNRTEAGDDCATFRHGGFGVEPRTLPDFLDTSSCSAASGSRLDGRILC